MKIKSKHADEDGMLDGPNGVYDIKNKLDNKVTDMMAE